MRNLTGQQGRRRRFDVTTPAAASISGLGDVTARGALAAGRGILLPPRERQRSQQIQPIDGDAHRRAQRLKERKVVRSHHPIVEAAADHQDAGQVRAGTGDRRQNAGLSRDDPLRVRSGQPHEGGSRGVGMDRDGRAGRLQYVDDRRGARQRGDARSGSGEVSGVGIGRGRRDQQVRRRPSNRERRPRLRSTRHAARPGPAPAPTWRRPARYGGPPHGDRPRRAAAPGFVRATRTSTRRWRAPRKDPGAQRPRRRSRDPQPATGRPAAGPGRRRPGRWRAGCRARGGGPAARAARTGPSPRPDWPRQRRPNTVTHRA